MLALALAALACLVMGGAPATPAAEVEQPNVIFFLVDDMGYADIGAYGNTYHQTPNIDRLAAQGMRFTNAYAAAPNCSPTRASILTGKWPARVGVTQYLPGNYFPYSKLIQASLPAGLPLDEVILPEPLSEAGYATASIGKWHLGAEEYLPDRRGFDVNFAGRVHGHHRTMFAPFPVLKAPGVDQGEYLTDLLAGRSEKFMEENRDRPFFLYLPFYAVHSPIEAKDELIKDYGRLRDPSGRNYKTYAAMVEGVDQAVGRIMEKVEDLGLAGRTIFFFFSDNGGVESRAFNGGFRKGKGWLYEGGIREPLFVVWPGAVEPGSVCDTPVSSVDFYPTILEMTGVSDSDGHRPDGRSLVPLLKQTEDWDREALYWHYPHYSNAGSSPTGAIREGNFKLMEFFEDERVELYNLAFDPGEAQDISAVLPEKAKNLRRKLADWRERAGAKPALPNPDYDPERARERGPVPAPSP